ncbi:MAG: BON domain-containing protein [Chloroflexota bacterium]|nr:BON domain-containing protein [Chloroflexota bacterium]
MSNTEELHNQRVPTDEELGLEGGLVDDESLEAQDDVEVVSLDSLDPDLSNDLGTLTAMESTDEGEPWFPPTDPVIEAVGNSEGAARVVGGLDQAHDENLRDDVDEDEYLATSDDELTGMVEDALARDGTTAALDVQVLVSNGVVTLRGNVEHIVDAEAAESVAGQVPGVVDVREELQIGTL